MNIFKNTLLLGTIFLGTMCFGQVVGGKKNATGVEQDEKAAFDAQIQSNREAARASLKPYKYDGTKTTTFSFKPYTYAKEVEVLTIQDTDYMLSFNANAVTKEKIIVKIFDGPDTAPGRILLYENSSVGGNEFVVTTEALNTKFRAERTKQDPSNYELINKMRLKKVFISYIIPAVDREVQTEQISKTKTVSTTIVTFNAIVVAVGFKTM